MSLLQQPRYAAARALRDALEAAITLVAANMARQVGRGKIAEADMDAALKRIETTITCIGWSHDQGP